jgi:hypothetical protein
VLGLPQCEANASLADPELNAPRPDSHTPTQPPQHFRGQYTQTPAKAGSTNINQGMMAETKSV